jgi:hypothetical protein
MGIDYAKIVAVGFVLFALQAMWTVGMSLWR